MGIDKTKKELLCKYHDMMCEDCKLIGKGVSLKLEELEIHRIHPGYMGGTYDDHRNLKVVCLKHHDIYSSAQRIAGGIQS